MRYRAVSYVEANDLEYADRFTAVTISKMREGTSSGWNSLGRVEDSAQAEQSLLEFSMGRDARTLFTVNLGSVFLLGYGC